MGLDVIQQSTIQQFLEQNNTHKKTISSSAKEEIRRLSDALQEQVEINKLQIELIQTQAEKIEKLDQRLSGAIKELNVLIDAHNDRVKEAEAEKSLSSPPRYGSMYS